MTTNRLVTRRERPQDWPLFQSMPLADDVGVISLEVLRNPQEDLAAAVLDSSSALLSSLAAVPEALNKIALVAAGVAVDPSSKVAGYHAGRDKLWTALEKSGLSVPQGRRLESKVQYDDGLVGFIGVIDVDLVELPTALEVTRKVNAVCICTATSESAQLLYDGSRALVTCAPNSRSLLKLMISRAERGDLVACGYGEFDDRRVGVEVFAKDSILDRLEEAVNRRA